LKPTQTRKPWEEEEKSGETEETEAPRPVGVRNIASRFNVSSNNGGNEVLETKLKNHTKNEVEKIRKEFQQLLQEEQEKRSQLESLVQDLLERVKQLESKE
jgi:isopropylmalate/homocitrate/citramalate synthase